MPSFEKLWNKTVKRYSSVEHGDFAYKIAYEISSLIYFELKKLVALRCTQ